MSGDTWPEGESSFDETGGDEGAWLDGADEPGFDGDAQDIDDDTVDLQLGDEDDGPGAPADGDDLEVGEESALDDEDYTGFDDTGEETAPETDGPAAEDTAWFAPDITEEPPLGADPDHDDLVDSGDWPADAFPPSLEFDDPPEPVDGLPWSDPAMLGDINDGVIDTAQADYSPPDVSDLLAYNGADAPADGGDVWAELLGSEDPATSGLARWWAPNV